MSPVAIVLVAALSGASRSSSCIVDALRTLQRDNVSLAISRNLYPSQYGCSRTLSIRHYSRLSCSSRQRNAQLPAARQAAVQAVQQIIPQLAQHGTASRCWSCLGRCVNSSSARAIC